MVTGKDVVRFLKLKHLTFIEIGGCARQDNDPVRMPRSSFPAPVNTSGHKKGDHREGMLMASTSWNRQGSECSPGPVRKEGRSANTSILAQ